MRPDASVIESTVSGVRNLFLPADLGFSAGAFLGHCFNLHEAFVRDRGPR
jgi:hypothetical protein